MLEQLRQKIAELERLTADLDRRLRVFEEEKAEDEKLIKEGLQKQFPKYDWNSSTTYLE